MIITSSLNAYLVKRTFRLDIKVISHIHNCYPFLKGKNFNKLLDSYFRPRYDYNISCGSLVYEFYRENILNTLELIKQKYYLMPWI